MPLPVASIEKLPDSETSCLRCDRLMKAAGPLEFSEGRASTWLTLLTQMGELSLKTITFDVLVCPGCGKVELFV